MADSTAWVRSLYPERSGASERSLPPISIRRTVEEPSKQELSFLSQRL